MKEIGAARARLAAVTSQAQKAGEELKRAEVAADGLRARVKERELELARSGDPLPSEPFEEEKLLSQAERAVRVAKARAEMQQDLLNGTQSEIAELRRKLDAAWLQFGNQQYEQAKTRLAEAAVPLRKLFAEMIAWVHITGAKGKSYVPQVAVQAATEGNANDAWIIKSDWHGDVRLSEPMASEFFAELRALRAEVEAAKRPEA
jgi:DNA repair exonuclease SbcCD ATPase subunit